MSRLSIFLRVLLLLLPLAGWSQRVIYSGYLPAGNDDRFFFAGKAGTHYWIEKDRPSRRGSKNADAEWPDRTFLLLDDNLRAEAEIRPPAVNFDKAWLVAGLKAFDQLSVRSEAGHSLIDLLRFSADGYSISPLRAADTLPYIAHAGQILLCRSADRQRLMLMAFENAPGESVRVHTLLYDQDWHLLQRAVIANAGFTQPCIQDDPIGLPGESFDNLPIKLSNRGDWTMTTLSATNGHYVFVHGRAGSVSITDLPLSPFFQVEDLAMNLDEEGKRCSLGLLSRYKRTSLKHVRITRYDLNGDRLIFDSAWQFNSLAANLYNSGLVNESFVGMPGGFMLFKEYGRNGLRDLAQEEPAVPGDPVFFPAIFSGGEPLPSLKQDSYIKKAGLQGMRPQFERGNLSMFYFPGVSGDSTWSGLINTQQVTELNRPALSYLVFAREGKIFILYRATYEGIGEPAVTTALDSHGQETGDAVIFWKLNRELDFQQALRFSKDEIAVPFQNNRQTGFAVIRLKE